MKSIIPLDENINNIKFDLKNNSICIDNGCITISGLKFIIDKETLVVTDSNFITKETNIEVEPITDIIKNKEEIDDIKESSYSVYEEKEDIYNGKERDQLKINKARDNMKNKLMNEIKNEFGEYLNISKKDLYELEVCKGSIRDDNANILLKVSNLYESDSETQSLKIKVLYSKDYSPNNKEIISGYFTLDYKRYNDSDFYIFAIESNDEKPHYLVVSRPVMNAILEKKKGKGSIYRFNIKSNRYGDKKEVYDTADLIDNVNKIDLNKYYRNLQIIPYYVLQLNIKKNIMDFNSCDKFEFIENIDEMRKNINGVILSDTNFKSVIKQNGKDINFKGYFVFGEFSPYIRKEDLINNDIFVFMLKDDDGIYYYSFNKNNIDKVINKEGKYSYGIYKKIKSENLKESLWNIEDILKK